MNREQWLEEIAVGLSFLAGAQVPFLLLLWIVRSALEEWS